MARTQPPTRRPLWWLPLLVLSGWLASGCDDDDGNLDISNGCDIRNARCQAAVFDMTADIRQQTGATPPPVRTISRASFMELLEESAADIDDEQLSTWTDALQILGLLSPDTDYAEAIVGVSTARIAAFYNDETGSITVIDRGTPRDPLDEVFTLSHEYVHALQDQQTPLSEFRDRWATSTDGEVAITTLVEGEATVLAAATLDELLGATRSLNWNAFLDGIEKNINEAITDAPETFITGLRTLPYTIGARSLRPIWRDAGQAGLDDLYTEPTLTMADWLDTGVDPKRGEQPLPCYPTVGPPGFEPVNHDTLGIVALMALDLELGGRSPIGTLQTWAYRWENDSLVVFRDRETDQTAVAWRVRLTNGAEDLVGRINALDTGAVAQVVPDSDEEVLVFGSTDPEAIEAWTDVATCGSEHDLPDNDRDPEADNARRTMGRPVGAHEGLSPYGPVANQRVGAYPR